MILPSLRHGLFGSEGSGEDRTDFLDTIASIARRYFRVADQLMSTRITKSQKRLESLSGVCVVERNGLRDGQIRRTR